MVDFFVLMILPGAGDELQGIKRGVMEMADGIIIHKSDGSNIDLAKIAEKQCKNALHLFPAKENGWIPFTHQVSSLDERGHNEIYQYCMTYKKEMTSNGYWYQRRTDQNVFWFEETIQQRFQELLYTDTSVKALFDQLKKEVSTHQITPTSAAEKVMAHFLERLRNKNLDGLL